MLLALPSRDPWYYGPAGWYGPDGTHQSHGFVARDRRAADHLLAEVGWWNMLGPGHVERLREAGADELLHQPEPVTTATGAPRWTLTIGESARWLPHDPQATSLHEEARELIRPLLYTAQERRDLTNRR